jgi:cytochrome c-type biogenesis protein CcmE
MSKGAALAVKIAISVLLVGGALTYLVVSSFGESMIYYKTVGELVAERSRFEGQPIRVNGLLVEGSVKQQPGTDHYRFVLSKNTTELEVSYTGILPDSMAPGRELVVEGVLQPGGNRFAASEILTKCPSKYEDVAKAKGGK